MARSRQRLRPRRRDLVFARALLERAGDLLAEAVEIEAAQLHGLELGMGDRVDRPAVVQHLEVQVRAGRAAGAADEADQLAAHDRLAGLDAGREGHEMAVHGGELAAMIDAHPVAVTAVGGSADHHAVGRGIDRRAGTSHEIDAFVHEQRPLRPGRGGLEAAIGRQATERHRHAGRAAVAGSAAGRQAGRQRLAAHRSAHRLAPSGRGHGTRLVEGVGAQAEARRHGDRVERQAERRRRRRQAIGEPQALDLVARAEAVDGDRPARGQRELGPQDAADADRRASREGLLVANVQRSPGLMSR